MSDTQAPSTKQRAILLIEGRQDGVPSTSLLLETLIPAPVLARMREKRYEIISTWLFYDDLRRDVDFDIFNAALSARDDAVYAARARIDQTSFVDISNGIPNCYEVVMVVTCLPY